MSVAAVGIARTLVMEAIAAGKHVVTANKALLAVHGTEIFPMACPDISRETAASIAAWARGDTLPR